MTHKSFQQEEVFRGSCVAIVGGCSRLVQLHRLRRLLLNSYQRRQIWMVSVANISQSPLPGKVRRESRGRITLIILGLMGNIPGLQASIPNARPSDKKANRELQQIYSFMEEDSGHHQPAAPSRMAQIILSWITGWVNAPSWVRRFYIKHAHSR